jgi:hypothetical protein
VIIIRGTLIAIVLSMTACSGLDFGDRPGRDVAKESGPLTVPPAHLKDGRSE